MEDESDSLSEDESTLTHKLKMCNSPLLVSQIQKAFSHVKQFDQEEKPHRMSDVTELAESKARKERNSFQIPERYSSGNVFEEFTSGEKEELTKSFVRNLPVPIPDKRIYRESFSMPYERKPWYMKISEQLKSRWEDLKNLLDFWSEALKIIEAQHGAAIVAYFLFIRWLLYMNIIIFMLNLLFIISPQVMFTHAEIVSDDHHNVLNVTNKSSTVSLVESKDNLTEVYLNEESETAMFNIFENGHTEHSKENISSASSIDVIVTHCKELYQQQIFNHSVSGFLAAFQNFIQGTGPLESTIFFTGFYSPFKITPHGYEYKMSFAFICVLLVTFIICCIMMIEYSSTGIQEAFVAKNQHSHYYSNEIFSAWNFCIVDPKTADQHRDHVTLEIKTNLHEDRTKRKQSSRSQKAWTKLYAVRFIINVFIILWLLFALYLIYLAAEFQMQEMKYEVGTGLRTLYVQFLPALTIVVFNGISPIIFDFLVYFEDYSSLIRVNLSICRNVFFYLASVFVLLNTMRSQITCKKKDICGLGISRTCHSPRCWETYVGQQLFKLSLVDVFVYIGYFFGYDVVQYYITSNLDNECTRFWGHPVFFLPTEILAPIYSQTVLWLGVLYCPFLPLLMIFKLIMIFHIKKIKILILCEPAKESYRASRFNAVFILILFISFFTVGMVHNYAIESIPASRGCGPFRYYRTFIKAVPENIRKVMSVLMSYWSISLITIILCFAINYYWRVLASQKELVKRLKDYLVIQSYDKQFLLKSIAELLPEKPPKQETDRSSIRR